MNELPLSIGDICCFESPALTGLIAYHELSSLSLIFSLVKLIKLSPSSLLVPCLALNPVHYCFQLFMLSEFSTLSVLCRFICRSIFFKKKKVSYYNSETHFGHIRIKR